MTASSKPRKCSISNVRGLVDERPDGVSRRAREILETVEGTDAGLYRERIFARERMRSAHRTLAPLVDALISPSAPGTAPLYVTDGADGPLPPHPTGNPILNVPSSVLGAPAVTMPLVMVGGLPLGIQIMGQPHADARTTAIARWIVENLERVDM